MSDLAFNVNGEPFEAPANAAGWRVRRLKQKGAPEVVYGRDGLPLVLPLDAELEDLRSEVGTPGRYRVDPVDEGHRPIANASAGYVFVHAAPRATESTEAPKAATDNVAIEAMRMNADMARTIIDRFPQMMEAAATLLRAADGAGLPARTPRALDIDDEDDDEVTQPRIGFDMPGFLGQVAPLLAPLLSNLGKGGMSSVAEALDWRKASKRSAVPARTSHKDTRPDGPGDTVIAAAAFDDDEVTENTSVIPPLDPQTIAHFIAIQAALKPEEAALARDVASNLNPPELHAWFDELKKLSVPQAVQKIRVLVAGNTEAVS